MAGEYKVYAGGLAAAATNCTFNLGRSFQEVNLMIATMASSSALDVYASPDGVTYGQMRKPPCSTTTVQIWTYTIAATCTANGSIVPIPPGFQYYKFVATDSAPTAAISFTIICGSN